MGTDALIFIVGAVVGTMAIMGILSDRSRKQ